MARVEQRLLQRERLFSQGGLKHQFRTEADMEPRLAMMSGVGVVGCPLLIVLLLKNLGPNWLELLGPIVALCVLFVLGTLISLTVVSGYIALYAAIINRR
jgi:hypothetical protein